MHRRSSTVLIGLSLTMALVTGCNTSVPMKPVSELPPSVIGIWESNGYGYILDATGEYVRLFHNTPEFCIEDTDSAAELTKYLTDENLSYRAEKQALYFAPTFEDYPIELAKIPLRPSTCWEDVATDPVTVFDSFASYMKAHYAFFDLYGVDWDNAVQSARAGVSPDMSDAELFAIMSDLLEPLKDGHIDLDAIIDGKAENYKPGRSTVGEALQRMAKREGGDMSDLGDRFLEKHWVSGIRKRILNGKGKMAANSTIQYGLTLDDIGYFAVMMEGNYADKGLGFEAEDRAVLTKTMDDAIAMFNEASAKAVIIDLSINFGGYDFISHDIASRFAAERTFAYDKYAADSTITEPYKIYIDPSPRERYTGPVALVTSNNTISAGEMLTMGLRALPNVVHIGEATRGAHSDVLTKKLPNGWVMELSNEVYHDHTGEFWEGRGIAPDIELQIFNRNNPFQGHIDAIGTVVRRIDNGDLIKP